MIDETEIRTLSRIMGLDFSNNWKTWADHHKMTDKEYKEELQAIKDDIANDCYVVKEYGEKVLRDFIKANK